jgi:hypothetical protein
MLGALQGASSAPNVFVMSDRGPKHCALYISTDALPGGVSRGQPPR